MSNIPNCNAIVNGRDVYQVSFISSIKNMLFDTVGVYVFGCLFVLFLTIYAFSKNIVILVFGILFFIIAIINWYLLRYGGNNVSQRPCKNSRGEVLY